MILLGLSQAEIAEKLNVGKKTVERDYAAIREDIQKEYEKNEFEDGLLRFVLGYDKLSRLLWKNLQGADKEGDRRDVAKLAYQVRELTNDRVKILHSLGLINEKVQDNDIKVGWVGTCFKCAETCKHEKKNKY